MTEWVLCFIVGGMLCCLTSQAMAVIRWRKQAMEYQSAATVEAHLFDEAQKRANELQAAAASEAQKNDELRDQYRQLIAECERRSAAMAALTSERDDWRKLAQQRGDELRGIRNMFGGETVVTMD